MSINTNFDKYLGQYLNNLVKSGDNLCPNLQSQDDENRKILIWYPIRGLKQLTSDVCHTLGTNNGQIFG